VWEEILSDIAFLSPKENVLSGIRNFDFGAI